MTFGDWLGRALMMGGCTVAVRPDVIGDSVLYFEHIAVLHPIIAAIATTNTLMPAGMRNRASAAYGPTITAFIERIAAHLVIYTAFDQMGIAPGGRAGVIATFVKPLTFIGACFATVRLTDSILPRTTILDAARLAIFALVPAAVAMCMNAYFCQHC